MKKLLIAFFCLLSFSGFSQVAISNPSSTPDASAMLDVKSTTKGVLLPRMTYTQRNAIPSPAQGLIVYQTNNSTTPRGFYIFDGTSWQEMAKAEDIAVAGNSWTVSGSNQYSGVSGNVGIGTATPDDKLDINGNLKLTGSARLLRFETAQGGSGSPISSTKYAPGLQFLRTGTTTVLGKFEYVDTVDYTNFFRLYTGPTVSNDFILTTDHNIGIGTTLPQAKLQISAGAENLRLHSLSDPLLQFATGPQTLQAKKGFIDISGNDFRLGTNAENDAGKFIVRINGTNLVNITPALNVGIGTASPAAKLHVVGKIIADADGEALKIDGNVPVVNFYHNGSFKSFISQNNTELYVGANGILHLDGSNGVAIGAVATGGNNYKLAVAGNVVCEELRVKLRSNWPDYVFATNYHLPKLSDVEQFIQMHQHLPNIPKAADIKKEGLEVGDMQKRMMEKIEELTLYIIDLQKQIDALKANQPKAN